MTAENGVVLVVTTLWPDAARAAKEAAVGVDTVDAEVEARMRASLPVS